MKEIPNYEGLYSVTKNGKVWSHPKLHGNAPWKGRWLRQYTERTGYKFVFLQKDKKRKLCFIHGLVAKTYLGDFSNTLQVNHKDTIKSNNNLENLEWITASENIRHSFKNNRSCQVGSRNACAKLNESDVISILREHNKGATQISLSLKFKISRAVVNRIIKNLIWRHVPR